jgi:hypothetical protein
MKKVLTGIFIVGISLSCMIENGKPPAENGNLSGIVTYQDVYTSAKQTDAGAEIYAVNETDVRSEVVIGNFQFQKSNYLLSINTLIDPAKIKKAQDNFDTAANLAFKYISEYKQLRTVKKTATDGAGKYTINVEPGRYYVLVISGSVKNNNRAESTGKFDFKIVEVKASGKTLPDVNFIRHERVITFAPVPAGC